MEPRTRGLIPYDADNTADARHPPAGVTEAAAAELRELAEAADRLGASRCQEVEARGTVYRIARTRRLLRWGPDGPESPRRSDTSTHAPAALHPRLDEDGPSTSRSQRDDEHPPARCSPSPPTGCNRTSCRTSDTRTRLAG